jgi:hypothetical protein
MKKSTIHPPNNGMHLTADTNDVIGSKGPGRRVMPGVMLLRILLLAVWM